MSDRVFNSSAPPIRSSRAGCVPLRRSRVGERDHLEPLETGIASYASMASITILYQEKRKRIKLRTSEGRFRVKKVTRKSDASDAVDAL